MQKQQSEVNKELSRLNIKEKVLNNKSEDNINRNAFEIKRFGNKLNKNRNLSNSRDKILHKKEIKTISPDEIYKKSKI